MNTINQSLSDQLKEKAGVPVCIKDQLHTTLPAIREKLLEIVRPGLLLIQIGVPTMEHAEELAAALRVSGNELNATAESGMTSNYVLIRLVQGIAIYSEGNTNFDLDFRFNILPRPPLPPAPSLPTTSTIDSTQITSPNSYRGSAPEWYLDAVREGLTEIRWDEAGWARKLDTRIKYFFRS